MRVLLVALLIALGLASPAAAATSHVGVVATTPSAPPSTTPAAPPVETVAAKAPEVELDDPRVETALAIAEAYWAPLPTICAPGAPSRFRVLVYVDPPADVIGRADQGECAIYIDRRWSSAASDVQFCDLIRHELGHMKGRRHGDYATALDPDGVMHERSDPIRPCVWPAAAAPALAPAPAPIVASPAKPVVERRKAWRLKDRSWCRKHRATCGRKYPRLYARALPTRA